MNRLVIIGNGFDLAHGLPTSYGHFINDFWKNFRKRHKSDEYQKLISTNDAYDGYYSGYKLIESFDDFKSNLSEYCKEYSYKYNDDKLAAFAVPTTEIKTIFEFRSDFFKIINIKNSQNWVDIENEYYYQLKKIIKSESLDTSKSKEYWSKEQRIQVEKLNKEFEQVKKLLEKYLKEKVVASFNSGLIQGSDYEQFKFCDILRPISILNKELNLDKEFSSDDYKEIENDFETRNVEDSKGLFRILNFNYTPTALRYLRVQNLNDDLAKTHISIHGVIGNENEYKINFGFGDEMDDDYKAIENLDDNEYLKNFKSFQYLQNSNYKNLLDFIDSNKFQVLIMGHSCGLSDRTLLNTVFEHNNCRSIKVFYHETKDENGKVIKDNYTEIIQNISRHFNKKKLMREKIVNKTLCQPLPQIQLPLK